MVEIVAKEIKKGKQWVTAHLLWVAFFISFFAHLMVMPIDMSFTDLVTKAVSEQPMRLKLINRSTTNPQQIVNTEETANEKRPEDAKFLGKKNQTFNRQTVAANVGSFKNAGLGVKNGFKVNNYKKVTKQKSEKKEKSQKKAVKKDIVKALKKIKMSDLAMNHKKHHKQKQPKAMPSLAALGLENGSRTTNGLSANSDFVEDLPLGDMTNLNTQEYKYFGFFDRIRKKLEQHWGSSLKEKAKAMMNRGVRIPASENKITSLKIILDNYGNIVEVLVKSTSGVSELDDAAIESFNKAGPFPNPPKGMIQNGQAIIEWGFVVKG